MRKITLPSTVVLAAMLALLVHAALAQAQLNRSWVASNGSGTNCIRATPCASFQDAHDGTNPGGEINCVDPGSYGPVTITKAISIVCDNTQAGIGVAGSIGITVNAGANDIVTLKGLDIEGLGSGAVGILFNSGAALHVHKVQVRKFRLNEPQGTSGILFQPSAYAALYVADSYITDNGVLGQAFSGGIVIVPFSSGSVNAFISRVRLENNAVGIIADGSQSTGVAANASVIDSTVIGSAGNGIQAVTSAGHAAVSVFVDHSVVSGNFASGIIANGTGAVARIGDSTIVLNVAGVSASGGGVLHSFKNNRISGNLTDGTPIPAFPGPGGTPLQ